MFLKKKIAKTETECVNFSFVIEISYQFHRDNLQISVIFICQNFVNERKQFELLRILIVIRGNQIMNIYILTSENGEKWVQVQNIKTINVIKRIFTQVSLSCHYS